MKRRLIFRTDANTKIGRGHLSRCLAIADMLKETMDVLFVVLQENITYFQNLGIGYELIKVSSDKFFIDVLTKEDIVWLDGYHFGEPFKKEVRKNVYKLIETNDIPYKVQNIDILFNHTPGLKEENFKDTPKDCKLYLGLDYALLRQRFLNKAKQQRVELNGEGVFVCFGGADTFMLGKKFVHSLLERNFKEPIYWITRPEMAASIDLSKNSNVHVLYGLDASEMIHYMTESKMLLIPSSVLSFEAIALKKPIFTGFFVDNQELIFKGLIEKEIAEGYGYLETYKHVDLATSLFLDFYENDKKQLEQIECQKVTIDGNSGARISNIIKKL